VGTGGRRPRGVGLALLAAAVLVAVAALPGCGSVGSSAGPGAAAGASAPAGASVRASASASASAQASPSPQKSPSARPTPKPATPKPGAKPASPAGAAGGVAARIVFVDVGQGDATIIRSGAWAGLIDGGPAGSEGRIEAALGRLGVRRLSTVFVSHMHADHIGGLPGVVADLRPRQAFVAGGVKSSLASAFRAAGTSVIQARRGGALRFGALRMSVLSPANISGDANGDSLVLLVAAGGRRFLFTGDCTGPNEAAVGSICARGPPVDVLKVAHHGSRYSSTTGFLDSTRPRTAVISVGVNSYGHPTQETIDRLRSSGARVFSTQKNGSITVTVSSGGAVAWQFARSSAQVRRGAAGGGGSGSSTAGGGAAAGAAGGGGAGGNTVVFVTRTGACYHVKGCRYLKSSRIAIKLKDAKAQGYRPCSVCDPTR
jgi:competence protein ComEC